MRYALILGTTGLCLSLAQAVHASPLSMDKAYVRCLLKNVEVLGAENQEHYSKVLSKAKANCIGFERGLDRETASTRNFADPAGNWFGTSKDELVERAERAAVEALFAARAKAANRR